MCSCGARFADWRAHWVDVSFCCLECKAEHVVGAKSCEVARLDGWLSCACYPTCDCVRCVYAGVSVTLT